MERRQNINIPVRTPLVSLTRSMGTTGIYHLGSILSPASNRSSNRRSSCRGSTGLNRAEEGAKSEAPGWELRELREREEEREVEAEELGAAGEPDAKQAPLFLPTPSFMASAEKDGGADCAFFCLFPGSLALVRTPFLCDFLCADLIFLRQAWVECIRELAMCRQHADSRREKRIKGAPPVV